MSFIIKDRVKEATNTTGTGDVSLAGAASGFSQFQSVMANGDTTYYAIVNPTSGVDEWEVGLGTWNTNNTLSRTTVLSGTNGTAPVNFSTGVKEVFITYPASKAVFKDINGDVNSITNLMTTGMLDVGTYAQIGTHIDLDTTANTKPAHREGRLFYDAANGALGFYNEDADLTLQIGQEEWLRVINNTGATIISGIPVYLNGEVGGIPSIVTAKANGSFVESQAVGITSHSIETGTVGYITVRGIVADIDTSHLTVGQKVHVAINGGTQTASPTYPFYPDEIGICLISAAVGGCLYVQLNSEAFQTLRVTGNSYMDGSLTVAGNLNILGSQTISSSSNIAIANAWNYFNSGDTIGALNTAFTGTGLDDASLTGHFTGPVQTNYYVRIDGVGTGTGGVDTFEWSTDNFVTFIAQDVDITGDDQLIHSTDNIAIKFEATTGHTIGDIWTGTGAPVNVDTGFASNRNTGNTGIGYTHLGIFYDVSTNKWTVFDEYDPEPEGTIDITDPSFNYGTLKAGSFEGDLLGNVTGNLTGNVSGSLTGDSAGTHTGAVSGNVTGNVTGNADTATKLATARTIQLTGDVTGSVSFDGTTDVNITAVVLDDGHAHIIDNVDGLQTALNAKVDKTTTLTAGNGLSGGGDLSVNRTISHGDTSSVPNVANTGNTFIQGLTFDGYGHILTTASGSVTVGDGSMTVTAGAGLTGGGQVGTANQSGASSVTVSHADTSTQASVNNSNGTVIQGITLDTYGHITSLGSIDLDARFVNTSGDTMTGPLVADTVTVNTRLVVPSGTSAQRPSGATEGTVRTNTDFGALEVFTDGEWAVIAVPPSILTVSPTGNITGTTGTVFSVTGSGFKAGTVVSFASNTYSNGASVFAPTTIINPGSLTATLPAPVIANYSPWYLTVTIPAGLAATFSADINPGSVPTFNQAVDTVLINKTWNSGTTGTVTASSSYGTGLSYSIVSGSLPNNHTLNASTGVISGTSNAVNTTTYTFTVKVTDANGAFATRQFKATLTNTAPSWSTASNLGSADQSDSVSVSVAATDAEGSGITYAHVAGTLPPGLSFSGNTLAGTTSSNASYATYNFTIRASDGFLTTDRAFTFTVAYGGPVPFIPNFAAASYNTTSSTTWTKPGNVRDKAMVWVYLVGGGGGGPPSQYDPSWQFKTAGHSSKIFVTTAALLNGATFTVGAGGPIQGDWRGNGSGGITTVTLTNGTTWNTGSAGNVYTHGITGMVGSASNSYFSISAATGIVTMNITNNDNNTWGLYTNYSYSTDTSPLTANPIVFGGGEAAAYYSGYYSHVTSTFGGDGGSGYNQAGQVPGGGSTTFNAGASGSVRVYYGA